MAERWVLAARGDSGMDPKKASEGAEVVCCVHGKPAGTAGQRFLAARGSLAGRITLTDDFEFTDAELNDVLDDFR